MMKPLFCKPDDDWDDYNDARMRRAAKAKEGYSKPPQETCVAVCHDDAVVCFMLV